MQIVFAVRSPFRSLMQTVPTPVLDPDTLEPTGVVLPVEQEIQVADYQIVVCHDETCPGFETDGHLSGAGDRSHHHDYRFIGDARPEADVLADVLASEETEAAGDIQVPLKF